LTKNSSMTSVITGDIRGSHKAIDPRQWISPLKELFNTFGKEPKVWQFYRGDSFQIEIKNIENALRASIHIKATVKCIKGLDVKIAIGIGDKTFDAPNVTESNGEAFVFSGQLFEKMKNNNMAVKTPWNDFDKQINLYLELALLTMDKWTPNSAEIVKVSLDNPNTTQSELGDLLNITQGRVSDRQKRAGFKEILKLDKRYRELVIEKTKNT